MFPYGELPPKHILQGRYAIIDRVGRGGMATVYKALDSNKNRIVAIKEMRIDSSQPPSIQQMTLQAFLKEIDILRELAKDRLHAPNGIPEFFDTFIENGRYYLVMEFIKGKTLLHLMSEQPNNQLSQEKVLNYAIQLCDILTFLHQQQSPVVFRDLKPGNIMVDTSIDRVYLIDFGIARHYKADSQQDTLPFFSPSYAPPELADEGQTEIRSDLYSLGATLHHCLTGAVPAGPNDRANWFKFKPISFYNTSYVATGLNNLIQQLVASRKEDRPSSAAEVKQRLEDIQIGANSETTDVLSYYDDLTVRTVQVYVSWSSRLPFRGLPRRVLRLSLLVAATIGTLLLRWGANTWHWSGRTLRWLIMTGIPQLGQGILTLSRNIASHRAASNRNNQQQQPNQPQGFQPGNNVNQPAGNVAISLPNAVWIRLTRLRPSLALPISTRTPDIALLTGLLSGAAAWSVFSLTFFHMAAHMLLFWLIFLLGIMTFIIYLQPFMHQAEGAGMLLSAVLLGTLFTGLCLFTLPDVQHLLSHYNAAQCISTFFSLILLMLTLASLFQRQSGLPWLDHAVMILLTLWDILFLVSAGPATLQKLLHTFGILMPVPDATLYTSITIAVLAFFAIISLFRIHAKFSWFDALLLLLLLVTILPLQFVLGPLVLGTLHNDTNAHINFINILFIALILFSVFILRWQKLTLLLLTISATISQSLVVAQAPSLTQWNLPIVTMLLTQPITSLHNGVLLLVALLTLLLCLLSGMIRRGRLLLTDRLVFISIEPVAILIEKTYRGPLPLPSFIQPGLEPQLLAATGTTVFIMLLLIALLTLLHAIDSQYTLGLGPLIRPLESLRHIGNMLLYLLYTGIMLLLLLTYIPFGSWTQPEQVLTHMAFGGSTSMALTGYQVAYAILIFFLLAFLLFALIRFLITSLKSMSDSFSIYKTSMGKEVSFIRCDWIDYGLLCTIILTLLLVVAQTVLSQPTIPMSSPLPSLLSREQLSLTNGLLSLLLIAALSLLWLGRRLPTLTIQALNALLPGAFVCLIIAFIASLLRWFQPMFLPFILAGILLFLGGLFLASIAESASTHP